MTTDKTKEEQGLSDNAIPHLVDRPENVQIGAAMGTGIVDPELQSEEAKTQSAVSAFKSLGFLDRFLAIWILLAMVIGIILGNFVPETGRALQKGKFVGVSVPIGMYRQAMPLRP